MSPPSIGVGRCWYCPAKPYSPRFLRKSDITSIFSRRGCKSSPLALKIILWFSELWKRYCLGNYQRQLRALWYYIACENYNLKIGRKHITKLERYSENPDECMFRAYKNKYNLQLGTEITKIFKGSKYKVVVTGVNDFVYESRHYKTLSAVAKDICGIKVSGYDFFGLNNKNTLKGKANG